MKRLAYYADTVYTDNRNTAEMTDYYEARIQALKSRVRELEAENRELLAELKQREEQH